MQINTMADVKALEQHAERRETPCGTGSLVWRRWGSGGDTIVLCHGGSGSWTHWIKTIPALASHHTVYAVDLPGLGDSASPVDMSHPAGCAEALAVGLRQLFTPQDQIRVVSFSFGVHVSTLALGGMGDFVRDFLVTGTSALGRLDRPVMEFPKERNTMTDTERRGVHRGVLEMLMFSNPDRIDDLAIELQAENVRKARFRSRVHAATDTVKKGLARVKVPLRTIWGANDVVGYPDIPTVVEILREHHPELKSKVIPDAGHWVMYEQADAYNEALLEMMNT